MTRLDSQSVRCNEKGIQTGVGIATTFKLMTLETKTSQWLQSEGAIKKINKLYFHTLAVYMIVETVHQSPNQSLIHQSTVRFQRLWGLCLFFQRWENKFDTIPTSIFHLRVVHQRKSAGRLLFFYYYFTVSMIKAKHPNAVKSEDPLNHICISLFGTFGSHALTSSCRIEPAEC